MELDVEVKNHIYKPHITIVCKSFSEMFKIQTQEYQGLETAIANKDKDIVKKEAEIEELQAELESIAIDLEELQKQYAEQIVDKDYYLSEYDSLNSRTRRFDHSN